MSLRPGCANAPVRSPDGHSLGHDATGPLVIGLVNNMPDPAFLATERQFRGLLAASCDRPIRLRLFSVPEILRGPACSAHVALAYESIDQLWDAQLDGLIVTGAEPLARVLEDEPYWPALARLTGWAERHTISAIWSCLAAQIAVLAADGIARRPFGWKLSGIFPCTKTAEHPLTAGLPPRWRAPQTRYNDLPEPALTASGYHILSRLPNAGADMFIKQRHSLFLLLQGHPEYDPKTLFHEYRRDVSRFLMGRRATYPDPVQGYFHAPTEAALDALREQALQTRDPALIDRLPNATAGWVPPDDWRRPAVQLYANWLRYLADCKGQGTPAMQSSGVMAANS